MKKFFKMNKKHLTVLISTVLVVILFILKIVPVMAYPSSWDYYTATGICETIYNDKVVKKEMDKYNDNLDVVGTENHGEENYEYTRLTVDEEKKQISAWFLSTYGPMLYYCSRHVNEAESTSIMFNQKISSYNNANFAYVTSNEDSLADAKSAAAKHYDRVSPPSVLINSSKNGLSDSVVSTLVGNKVKNVVVLGGSQRFSEMFAIGGNFNLLRIGGQERNETFELLRETTESIYNIPEKPHTDEKGVRCDIFDDKLQEIEPVIRALLEKGNFEGAAAKILDIQHGDKRSGKSGQISAFIGCKDKFLITYYVNPVGGFQYGIYQYIGEKYHYDKNNNGDKPDPPVHINKPPHVEIHAPQRVVMGDDVTITGQGFDPEKMPLEYWWSYDSEIFKVDKELEKKITGWFCEYGTQSVTLSATDPEGLSGEAYANIEVVQPIPQVKIESQNAKVNKKVNINNDGSQSTQGTGRSRSRYPFDYSKTTWELKPINININDIKLLTPHEITENAYGDKIIRIKGDYRNLELLSKKEGQISVCCTMFNKAGVRGFTKKNVYITKDEAPVANFTMNTNILREPSLGNRAKITVNSTSYSPDGDSIIKHVWFYAFDSNNDGNFDDETWYVYSGGVWHRVSDFTGGSGNYTDLKNINIHSIDDRNLTRLDILVPNVGKYKIELIVSEGFEIKGEVMKNFVSPDDFLMGNTFDH